MGPEELNLLIAALAQQMGSINPTLMASALPANNVSPANIASAMNPNVLLSSGLVDPSTIASGIDSTYQQLLADWSVRNNATLPYEASDAILAPVTSKYVGNDEVSSFMNEMFTAIKNGTTTADKVKTAIAASDSVAPDAVKAAYANVSVDLDNFGKLATAQSAAKAKFDYDQAQKGVTTAPAPTLEQARSKYYKDLGVPEMALLPDAGVGYDFDPSMFGDKAKTDRLARLVAEQQAVIDKGAPAAAYTQKQADVYTQKGNLDAAMRAGEKAKQDYLDRNPRGDIPNQIDDWFARNLAESGTYLKGWGAGPATIAGTVLGGLGKLFGEDKTQKRKDEAEAYGQETMKRVLAQLNKSVVPVSAETSEYGKSKKRLEILTDAQLRDAQYKQDVADYVSQKLAAKGRTPNQDIMNQLLGYASTVNQKK